MLKQNTVNVVTCNTVSEELNFLLYIETEYSTWSDM